jgi:hypothetical protein
MIQISSKCSDDVKPKTRRELASLTLVVSATTEITDASKKSRESIGVREQRMTMKEWAGYKM